MASYMYIHNKIILRIQYKDIYWSKVDIVIHNSYPLIEFNEAYWLIWLPVFTERYSNTLHYSLKQIFNAVKYICCVVEW